MTHVEVAERFGSTKGPITTTQLVMYAGASGDFNRIHYDLPFAREAGLPNVIAHGMLTMAFAGQLLTDCGGPGCEVRAIAARFTAPVVVGDTIELVGVVTAVEQDDRGRCASVDFDGTVGGRRVIAGSGKVSVPA